MINDSTLRLNGIVRLLHEGVAPPSGESVAAPLSPDRAAASALWKGLTPLAPTPPSPVPAEGCPYLEQRFDVPDAGNGADTIRLPAPLYLSGPATSSMDVARALALDGRLPVWGSVLALSQTSGRGQLGRRWVSPEGNVYAALRLPFLPPFTDTAAAPALGGLIAEALARLGYPVRMKWPNDLLQETAEAPHWRKVGGILIEERPRRGPDGKAAEPLLIAGIGLNLVSAPPESLMRAQRAVPAGRLASLTHSAPFPDSVGGLWLRLVSRMFFCYVEEIDAKGKNAWRALAERHLAFLGQSVLLTDGPDDRERHSGILAGLDDFGGLRLRNREGTTRFLFGSLQLERPPRQP